ncbi:MAG: DsrE family protein, partial [Oscillospiraceae bacterium]
TLIFMNGGVFLTTEGSAVLESLEMLELNGVEIISCGACLNFFGLQDKVAIGSVGNMYDFVTKMNEAQNTIKI